MIEGFASGFAEVNGTTLHYVAGGAGDPLVLLHGWPMTWHEWHKVMPALAERHRVIAVDLRGIGGSGRPESGYDKKTMARDVYELIRHLGHERADVAGNDIGSMVAFSLAVNHPEAVRRLALFEVSHPDTFFYQFTMLPQEGMPHLWWFAFNQVEDLPERLIRGRARLVVDWFIDRQAAEPAAISDRSRDTYAEAYDEPGAISATNRWYQAFGQDVEDMRGYGKITVPVLAIGGLYFDALQGAVAAKADDVRFVRIPDAGHYLAEERPDEVVKALTEFFA